MVETTSAATGGGGQRPVLLRPGWWPVAAAEEMTVAEAASAMAEAVAVMQVMMEAAAVAGVAGWCVIAALRPARPPPSCRLNRANIWGAPRFRSAETRLRGVKAPQKPVFVYSNKFKYKNRHFHPPTAGARRPDLHYVAFCSTQGQEPLVRARVAVEELFVRETDSLVLS